MVFIGFLESSLIRNQGVDLQACVNLSKRHNTECDSGWAPLRAKPDMHILIVMPFANGSQH